MNFFELAKKMEQEAVVYYENLAKEAKEFNISGVFTFLAEEEKKHYEWFNALEHKLGCNEAVDNDILKKAKNEFKTLVKPFTTAGDISNVEKAYITAMEKEKAAVAFYTAEKAKLTDEKDRKVVDIIIAQEARHVTLLDNVVQFIRKPREYLENAEFNHLTPM